MLNLFQHLMESITYQTLKRVQGDKKGITTQPRGGRVRVGVDHETFITPILTFPPQGGRRLRVCTLSQEELGLKARGFNYPRRGH
jgi:hypothetical protein